MTDVWTNPGDNDYENSCDSDDQQELESFLYSLVHHDSSLGEETGQGHVEEILSSTEGNSTGPQKGWRYFNVTPHKQGREDNFRRRLEQLSERYNCKTVRTRGLTVRKNPFWREKPVSHPVLMDNLRNRATRKFPNIVNMRSSPTVAGVSNLNHVSPANHAGSSKAEGISGTNANKKEDILEKQIIENACPEILDSSSSDEIKNLEERSSCSKQTLDNEKTPLSSQDNDEHNNTNPSLSSAEDCFELPQTSFSKPKSKCTQVLNDCMTQVLGSMLDEDASRSSIESEKRPVQKPSKSSSGTGWTVGMSWEDMSSKFRFNFEVDSVCGDSVREGSVSASSRANTPELAVETRELVSPDEISKYNVSLKTKENAPESMAVDDSDSEVESIVEISQPSKEPPPIVEILSDGEDFIPAKIIKLDDDPCVIEEDVVILYETGNSSSNRSAVSIPTVGTSTSRDPKSAKKKERQRKKAKQNKGATPSSTAKTGDDISDILAGMSNDPSLWKICREDMYPRPSPRKYKPCDNCKQRDHFTWHCPEPVKIKVCVLCAEPGHNHYRCPKKMCLACGMRTPSLTRRCHLCIRNNKICNICKWTGHTNDRCPDLWRRYHSTITTGPPVVPDDVRMKAPDNMYCCNCAEKGHYSHDCVSPSSSINEKILSHVVSYVDPTRGDNSEPSPSATPGRSSQSQKSQSVKSSVTKPAESSKPSPEINSIASSRVAQQPNSPEKNNQAAESTGSHVDLLQNSVFKNNYRSIATRVQSFDCLPSQSEALAGYLDRQLNMLNKPVIKGRNIHKAYVRLMAIMRRCKLKKKLLREAYLLASNLNMTILGYGGLADGETHVWELRKHVVELRAQQGKVSRDTKRVINDHFKVIFKGLIRSDLSTLISEYLKRERVMPS